VRADDDDRTVQAAQQLVGDTAEHRRRATVPVRAHGDHPAGERLDVIGDRRGDRIAREHLVHRFDRERRRAGRCRRAATAAGGDVGEAIDDGDHLELAVDRCSHPGRDRDGMPRRRRTVDRNDELLEHGTLLESLVAPRAAWIHGRNWPNDPTGPFGPRS
jgi:hypothetical protein